MKILSLFLALLVILGGIFVFSDKDLSNSLDSLDSTDLLEDSVDLLEEISFPYKKSTLSIGDFDFDVFISDTSELREKGLSVFNSLKDDEAMLFIFPKEDIYGFWMKDMKFPIDIVWLDKNGVITHIEEGISPESYPQIFFPVSRSLYVLEFISGTVRNLKIQKGDIINF